MCEYCGRREGHGHDVFCPNNPYTRFDARCCECGAGLLESMDEIYYDDDGARCASCHEAMLRDMGVEEDEDEKECR